MIENGDYSMLDGEKYIYNSMIIRKNEIETYDNLLIKIDNPSYEGSFYDIQNK